MPHAHRGARLLLGPTNPRWHANGILGTIPSLCSALKSLCDFRRLRHHHGWAWDGRKLVQVAECRTATAPKSNRQFWNEKFRRNVRRDAEHERLWAEQGWNLIVVWECGLKTAADRARTFAFILRKLKEWAG